MSSLDPQWKTHPLLRALPANYTTLFCLRPDLLLDRLKTLLDRSAGPTLAVLVRGALWTLQRKLGLPGAGLLDVQGWTARGFALDAGVALIELEQIEWACVGLRYYSDADQTMQQTLRSSLGSKRFETKGDLVFATGGARSMAYALYGNYVWLCVQASDRALVEQSWNKLHYAPARLGASLSLEQLQQRAVPAAALLMLPNEVSALATPETPSSETMVWLSAEQNRIEMSASTHVPKEDFAFWNDVFVSSPTPTNLLEESSALCTGINAMVLLRALGALPKVVDADAFELPAVVCVHRLAMDRLWELLEQEEIPAETLLQGLVDVSLVASSDRAEQLRSWLLEHTADGLWKREETHGEEVFVFSGAPGSAVTLYVGFEKTAVFAAPIRDRIAQLRRQSRLSLARKPFGQTHNPTAERWLTTKSPVFYLSAKILAEQLRAVAQSPASLKDSARSFALRRAADVVGGFADVLLHAHTKEEQAFFCLAVTM